MADEVVRVKAARGFYAIVDGKNTLISKGQTVPLSLRFAKEVQASGKAEILRDEAKEPAKQEKAGAK